MSTTTTRATSGIRLLLDGLAEIGGGERETDRAAKAVELIECLTALADAAWEQKDLTAARHACRLVLDQDATNAQALNRLGRIALMERNYEQAIEYFSEALFVQPDPVVCINLAVAYGRMGDFTQALMYCAEAIVLDVNFKPAYVQMSAIYDEMCQPADAEVVINRALSLCPGDDDLLFALSVHQLARGDYENGWRNYEHRAARLELAAKLDEYPEWKGEPLKSRVILVCGEQGMGDQIMWARYIPLLRELGAEVVFFTTVELARLMAQSFPDIQIVTSDREMAAIEPDYWVAMGGLPGRCLPSGDYGFPDGDAHTETYLAPDSADVDRFAVLIPDTGNLRVGLCWRGNPKHAWDRHRSLSWEQMRPLVDGFRRTSGRVCHNGDHVLDGNGVCANCAFGETQGVDFYSLQAGADESGLPSLVAYCHDFADTAAAISHLDLVVTVDTAVAHLAGAMGKDVRLLTGSPSDWRWGNGGPASTAWYPSMWIFHTAGRGVERAVQRLHDRLQVAVSFRGGASALLPESLSGQMTQSEIAARLLDLETAFGLSSAEFTRRARTGESLSGYTHGGECLSTSPLRAEWLVLIGGAPSSIRLTPATATKYGHASWPANDHYIGRALSLYGEYSESEAGMLRRVLRPGDVVVEAGANVGGLTLPLADAVGARGIVYACEPQPLYFGHLQMNCASHRGSIIPMRVALGSACEKVTMRAAEEQKVHAPGWASDGPEFAVQQIAIDSLELSRCALIKIDVDGPEHDILLGASATIDRCRPLVYVEYDKPEQYPDMLPWLAARGYRLYRHSAPLFNPQNFAGSAVNVFGSLISLMVLAVPDERKDLHPGEWGLERILVEKR